ncbi:hypothetical protein GCM10023147_41230 [Tsukamurella soli]|uniref:MgtC/SapB/SrpB/YhiD N-terminal domain-containing protein n=2 Tax=Tsukamurella soli TaxID=644556 RepID=A0ABP8K6T6_9ACTN
MVGLSQQLVPLGVAFVLSSVIGIEREIRHKVAGLRTHTMVGVGAAMLMLISKYGFDDILSVGRVVNNPGQLAGQIVTGIGFLGAGIIIVRHDNPHNVITAASIWIVAAIGMACGAGLYPIALAGMACDLVTSLVYTPLSEWIRSRPSPPNRE